MRADEKVREEAHAAAVEVADGLSLHGSRRVTFVQDYVLGYVTGATAEAKELLKILQDADKADKEVVHVGPAS